MKLNNLAQLLSETSYPGRGIVIGRSESGKYAVCAYFIMGRSVNSRNRVFTATDDGIKTEAFDPSLLSDPHLIIYNAVRKLGDDTIVTNGDQTDTVYEIMSAGKTFEEALRTREFEDDAPNFTPRISGILHFKNGKFSYEMNILKSSDGDSSSCERFTYQYFQPIAGEGRYIHTYMRDGNPLPSFTGEPEKVAIDDNIINFTNEIWENLNSDNKVSLYVKYTEIATGAEDVRIVNKNN